MRHETKCTPHGEAAVPPPASDTAAAAACLAAWPVCPLRRARGHRRTAWACAACPPRMLGCWRCALRPETSHLRHRRARLTHARPGSRPPLTRRCR
eukprot:356443-Chlamydomonas_euryale.AAC.3